MAQGLTPAAPERAVALDMARRSLPVAPLLLAVGAVGWGVDGALSAGFGLVLVVANLVLSALTLGWAARSGPTALMAAALGGFLARMVVMIVAVFAVKDQGWVETVPLGLTVVVTHLGLLLWESRYVSASLAFPALKPTRTGV